MLRLPEFKYLAPTGVAEAVRLYGECDGSAMYMAGGTDLLPNMKHRLFTPRYLIGLRRLKELRGVGRDAEGMRLGSCVTLTEVADHPLIRREYPALSEAAAQVSTPQLRNTGTIGGNLCLDTRCNYYNQTYDWRKAEGFCLKKEGSICTVAPGGTRCWATFSADTVPVLVALGATVRIVGPLGERVARVEDLYQDDGMRHLRLQPGELITEVSIPPADGAVSAFRKFRHRDAFDFPVANVAVAARIEADGTCQEIRIVLGAVASCPVRATEAERLLSSQRLDADAIEAAAERAVAAATPMDNTSGQPLHRKRLVRVLTRRALREVAGLDPGDFAAAAAGM